MITHHPFRAERLRPTRPHAPAMSRAESRRGPAAAVSATLAAVPPVLPGLLAAAGIGILATVIGRVTPLVGSAVPGALLGVLVALGWLRKGGRRARLAPGLKLASSRLLQCSVVILGAQLSLGTAARVGLASLPVMVGTLAV